VVEGLGVHAKDTASKLCQLSSSPIVPAQKCHTCDARQARYANGKNKYKDLLAVSLLDRNVRGVIKVNEARDGRKALHWLDKGELVEVARRDDGGVRVYREHLFNEGLQKYQSSSRASLPDTLGKAGR
jgi:hypothetical protein